MPLVDENFETNVPGLYIVGELGGRGLIKNAVNEGKMAVEHVARSLRPTAGGPMAIASAVDVVIVGSGPAGLSAGLEALRGGLSYVVLEQGSLSDTVRKYPRHKLLLAEPVRIPMYGDLWVADASKETLLQVWETIVANTGLDVRTGEKVQHVKRDGTVFRVETANSAYLARRVVLAMGRRGSPRRLGVPGEELDHVFYDIVEMEAFAGKRMVVVGGGDSAVESALGLANQKGTTVALSYRGDAFQRIAERNREKIERAIAAGKVTPYFKQPGARDPRRRGGARTRRRVDDPARRLRGDPHRRRGALRISRAARRADRREGRADSPAAGAGGVNADMSPRVRTPDAGAAGAIARRSRPVRWRRRTTSWRGRRTAPSATGCIASR